MLACLLAFAGTQGVVAAPEDPSPNSSRWSGLYVGLHAGYGWGDSAWNFPDPNFYTFTPNNTLPTNLDDYVLGGQLSFNRQVGSLVWGVEAAFSGRSVEHTTVGTLEPSFYLDDRFTTRVEAHGTLTARLGYTQGNYLLYGRGGAALGRVSFNAISGEPIAGTLTNGEKTLHGWTLGGGVEYMFSPGITLGIQYDLIRLDGKTYSMNTTGTSPGSPVVARIDAIDLHSITARLNIRLLP